MNIVSEGEKQSLDSVFVVVGAESHEKEGI